jgi:hypothetical protein
MTHPQNSPRGLFSKQTVYIGGVKLANPASTNLQLGGGLALSGQSTYLTANSTANIIFPVLAAIPATRVVGGIAFVSNSTGKSLVFHSTGTTWVYASKTSVLA